MSFSARFDAFHARVRATRWLHWFTWGTRILLALSFTPSGFTKLLGNRFTLLSPETPIGYFFEAMYQTGLYWRFIGAMQLVAAVLLLIPRTALIGALVYFPLILNIFVVTVALQFRGTPFITGPMLLASVYLLVWDYDRLKGLIGRAPSLAERRAALDTTGQGGVFHP